MTPTERRALELVMRGMGILLEHHGYRFAGDEILKGIEALHREAERENVENGR